MSEALERNSREARPEDPRVAPTPESSPDGVKPSRRSPISGVASASANTDDLVSVLELVDARCKFVLDGIARIGSATVG